MKPQVIEVEVKVKPDYSAIVEIMKEFDKQIKESNHVTVSGGTQPISYLLKASYAAFLKKTFNPEIE
jgi:hypothetical protein